VAFDAVAGWDALSESLSSLDNITSNVELQRVSGPRYLLPFSRLRWLDFIRVESENVILIIMVPNVYINSSSNRLYEEFECMDEFHDNHGPEILCLRSPFRLQLPLACLRGRPVLFPQLSLSINGHSMSYPKRVPIQMPSSFLWKLNNKQPFG
jgi:hypothetical protein